MNRVYVPADGTLTRDAFLARDQERVAVSRPTDRSSSSPSAVPRRGTRWRCRRPVVSLSRHPARELPGRSSGDGVERSGDCDLAIGANGRAADVSGEIPVTQSGWLLLRAWNDGPTPLFSTSIHTPRRARSYIRVGGKRRRSSSAAMYFLDWLDRIQEATPGNDSYRTTAEREAVLRDVAQARSFYEQCRREAGQGGKESPCDRWPSPRWRDWRSRCGAAAVAAQARRGDSRTRCRGPDAGRRAPASGHSATLGWPFPDACLPDAVRQAPRARGVDDVCARRRARLRGRRAGCSRAIRVHRRVSAVRERRPDGYDTIEWAARQPWSNDRVGTFGLSYPGAVQWLAAVDSPPHLDAMVPAMTFSTPQDFFYSGGVWDLSWTQWIWQSIAADARQTPSVGCCTSGPRADVERRQNDNARHAAARSDRGPARDRAVLTTTGSVVRRRIHSGTSPSCATRTPARARFSTCPDGMTTTMDPRERSPTTSGSWRRDARRYPELRFCWAHGSMASTRPPGRSSAIANSAEPPPSITTRSCWAGWIATCGTIAGARRSMVSAISSWVPTSGQHPAPGLLAAGNMCTSCRRQPRPVDPVRWHRPPRWHRALTAASSPIPIGRW